LVTVLAVTDKIVELALSSDFRDFEDALQYLKIEGETFPTVGLKFIRRKTTNGKYYYVVNHTAKNIDTLISLQYKAKGAMLLDPQTGKSGAIPFKIIKNTTQVYLSLEPGATIFIQLSDAPANAEPWLYYSDQSTRIEFENSWKLNFKEGGPQLPPDATLSRPVAWTILHDTTYQNFSGTGVYSTSFDIDKAKLIYELHIDSLYESAKIIMNGKAAGYIWAQPNKLDITSHLQNGSNTISIEVANLMANRIRYMDRNKIGWRNYHEINFVNIQYKPFDASAWPVMPSGMAGVYIEVKKLKLDKE